MELTNIRSCWGTGIGVTPGLCVHVVTNIVGQHTRWGGGKGPKASALPTATCYNCVCVFQSTFFLVPQSSAPAPSMPHLACSQCHKIFACSATFFSSCWSALCSCQHSSLSNIFPCPAPGTSSLVFAFCDALLDWIGGDWNGENRTANKTD